MSFLRPVGRSAATLHKDRVSLCGFTFADGRQCRTLSRFPSFLAPVQARIPDKPCPP